MPDDRRRPPGVFAVTAAELGSLPVMPTDPARDPAAAVVDAAIDHLTSIIAANVRLADNPAHFAESIRNAAIAVLADSFGETGPAREPLDVDARVMWRMPRGTWVRGRIERADDEHLYVRWDRGKPREVATGLARFPRTTDWLIREPRVPTPTTTRPEKDTPDV